VPVISIRFTLGRTAASAVHPADAPAAYRWCTTRLPCPL
jgi:hypothetical protein